MASGTGIVIVREHGSQMTYRRKCEACGHVDLSTTTCGKPHEGVILTGGVFRCPKCGNRQHFEIYG